MAELNASPLSTVPFFKDLTAEALARVAGLVTPAAYKARETIFLAHEPGDGMYVIESGRVRIWVQDTDGNDVTLTELGPGDFFGEMAIIDGAGRSASASCLEDCSLSYLKRQVFQDFLVEHPQAALAVIRGLGTRLRQTNLLVSQRAVRNANELHEQSLSVLDRAALAVTDKISSFGFFLIIAAWTVLWTGYNIVATMVSSLHWHAFDPFPAFVAYLLISNVIQIMLMPLIMVGQNLQGRHAETRAELDFQINQKAEKEVTATLLHLERNTQLLLTLMRHVKCEISDQQLLPITLEGQIVPPTGTLTPAAGSIRP